MAAPLRRAGTCGYLGALGSLVELPSVASLSEDYQRDVQVQTTLGGRRVAFVAPASRRAWSAGLPGQRSAEAGRLLELLRSNPGPFVWVSPYAQVTNVLSPAQTALDVAPVGGYVTGGFATTEGTTATAVAPSVAGNTLTLGPAPVVPGYPVTASVYVPGVPAAASLALRFTDATGAQVGSDVTWTPAAASSVGARPSVTATAPAGAAQVLVRVAGFTKYARPAVTWTADLLGWAPGHGCSQAVVESASGDVKTTFAQPWAPRTQEQSLTITEVG